MKCGCVIKCRDVDSEVIAWCGVCSLCCSNKLSGALEELYRAPQLPLCPATQQSAIILPTGCTVGL